ncbi:MAG: hypothetical protein ACREQW_12040 [Candidatus Binatia bacterium]
MDAKAYNLPDLVSVIGVPVVRVRDRCPLPSVFQGYEVAAIDSLGKRLVKMVEYLYFLLALISIGILYETGRTSTVRAIARFLFIILVIAFIAVLILAGSGMTHNTRGRIPLAAENIMPEPVSIAQMWSREERLFLIRYEPENESGN